MLQSMKEYLGDPIDADFAKVNQMNNRPHPGPTAVELRDEVAEKPGFSPSPPAEGGEGRGEGGSKFKSLLQPLPGLFPASPMPS